MRPDVVGEEPGLASQAQDSSAERDPRAAQRARRKQRAFVPGDYAWAISLIAEVGRTEKNLAATLHAMAEVGGSEAKAQRLKLAEEADKRAHDAAEHAAQLQRQVDQWAEHAEVVDLLKSLRHAGRVLTALACAEKDLAATLMRVAGHADPDRAAQLRRLADEALADARRADGRASSLRELAAWVIGRLHQASGSA